MTGNQLVVDPSIGLRRDRGEIGPLQANISEFGDSINVPTMDRRGNFRSITRPMVVRQEKKARIGVPGLERFMRVLTGTVEESRVRRSKRRDFASVQTQTCASLVNQKSSALTQF